jgi:hypothetical protein
MSNSCYAQKHTPIKLSGLSELVGDVSPKHRVGTSRLAPVFGGKSDSKPVSNTNCRPNTSSLSASADRLWVKTLRRKVAYQLT